MTHECPACGDQAPATGRRNRSVFYRCQCGLEFEVMTPGSPRPKADDSRNPYRLSSGSDASLTGQGAFASMLERHRDGGRRI